MQTVKEIEEHFHSIHRRNILEKERLEAFHKA
jgi:hypothetical protein